jgi:hypothetical protein
VRAAFGPLHLLALGEVLAKLDFGPFRPWMLQPAQLAKRQSISRHVVQASRHHIGLR